MLSSPLKEITNSPDDLVRAQFANLRTQIPLMYALMLMNAGFLALATVGEVPLTYSLAAPLLLLVGTAARSGIWIFRGFKDPDPETIRRYFRGTVFVSAVLSAGFGAWGVLLLQEAGPSRATAIALYVFVGSISCCYCLQALPIAGRFVLLFGALPITLTLAGSGDWYQVGTAASFLLVSGVILRTLTANHATMVASIKAQSAMSELIAALRQSEEHYRHSVDLNPQIPWISDPNGLLTELSPRWTRLTNLPVEQSLGARWIDNIHPEDLSRTRAQWREALTSGRTDLADARFRVRVADGSYRWFRSRAAPRRDADGTIISWYGNLEDIHDQVLAEQALQHSEERYRLASRATNDIIWDFRVDEGVISWSGATSAVLGFPETAEGTSFAWLLAHVHPDDRGRVGTEVRLDDPAFTYWSEEFRMLAASGEYLHMRSRGYVVRDKEGRATRLIGSLQDVTAERRFQDELRFAAHYDALTRLPNRLLFAERLDAALEDARRFGHEVILVVLDVDGFKTVNDSLGHDCGDALLREIAARLMESAPGQATVARLGGDEFAIILPGAPGGQNSIGAIETLLTDISTPMVYAGRTIEVGLSAGIAVALRDGAVAEELHKSADLALYAAKRDGPGRARTFQRELRDDAERQKQMLSDARAALQGEWIVPFYQPKVCLRSGKLLGLEALLRLHHPQQGLLAPHAIAAAFDDPGTSVQITDRMLDRAITDMAQWQEHGLDFGRLAINGSPEDFRRGDFADRILERLHRANLSPSLLELEVTETVFLRQLAANVSAALTTLSAEGVTIALDDFGTGYASLTHLKQFPVDALKIDRSFVSRLGSADGEDAAIVGAVIDLARNLGIDTVAEGIETPEQAKYLILKGCDAAQGFLFSRPLDADQVPRMVRDWSAKAMVGRCGTDDWGPEMRRQFLNRFT